MFCFECQSLKNVSDFFPPNTVRLECQHHRNACNRSEAEIAAYDIAVAEYANTRFVGWNGATERRSVDE
jgi:hypothetical protein